MREETTAKWIEEQIGRILNSYPREEVDRAIPVLLLLMARDFGFENLEPRMQKAVLKVQLRIGIDESTPEEQIGKKIQDFILSLNLNTKILDDIRHVFEIHYSTLQEETTTNYST